MVAMLVFNRSSEVQEVPPVPLPMTQELPDEPLIVTLPVLATLNTVVVAVPSVVEAIAKRAVFAAVLAVFEIESIANGDVVPTPIFPIATGRLDWVVPL